MNALVNVVFYALLTIVLLPCLLTISEGVNGQPTIWNLIGLVYMAALVVAVKKLRHHAGSTDKD